MANVKPSIFIYTSDLSNDYIEELCAGIEEEGVLYTVMLREGKVNHLAYEAANDSQLSVGIGLSNNAIAVQVRLLELGNNLFYYENPNKELCRMTGANSARVIKRTPFKGL